MSFMKTSVARVAAAATASIIASSALSLAVPSVGVAATNCAKPAFPTSFWTYIFQVGAVMNKLNEVRSQNGLPQLDTNGSVPLATAAQWASQDSANRGFSPANHIDTLGRNITTRFLQCGVTQSPGRWEFGEINHYSHGSGNTADSSALKALDFWLNQSPPHRAKVLDPDFKMVATAYRVVGDRYHWTVTFSS